MGDQHPCPDEVHIGSALQVLHAWLTTDEDARCPWRESITSRLSFKSC
jgi:hypothetical protein